MLRTCRQAVLSDVSPWITYVCGSVCRLPVAGRVLGQNTAVDADRLPCLRSAQYCCNRHIHGCVPHRLQSAPPWRTVFFGTDEYARVHLKALNENR